MFGNLPLPTTIIFLSLILPTTTMSISLLSTLAGYSIVIPSFFVQLPQILKIWHAGSADGISLPAVVSELCAFTIGGAFNWAKGYPFSAWGELVPAMVQTAMLAVLVVRWVVGGRIMQIIMPRIAGILGERSGLEDL